MPVLLLTSSSLGATLTPSNRHCHPVRYLGKEWSRTLNTSGSTTRFDEWFAHGGDDGSRSVKQLALDAAATPITPLKSRRRVKMKRRKVILDRQVRNQEIVARRQWILTMV